MAFLLPVVSVLSSLLELLFQYKQSRLLEQGKREGTGKSVAIHGQCARI
jgi:hypothetical protein